MSKDTNYQPVDLAAVRAQASAELSELLANKRKALYRARFIHNGGQRGKSHLLGRMRRDVARVATVLTEKKATERRVEALASAESSKA